MPDIQVVTLDLWQTLLIDRHEWGQERAQLRIQGAIKALREVKEFFSENQIREAYRACYRTCRAIHQEGRDVSFKEQVSIFVRGIDDGLLERINQQTFTSILNRYADSFFGSPPVMADGVPMMLHSVKMQGYRICLISNTGMTPGRAFRAYLEDLEIIQYFDHLTFSDEILITKPAKAIFLDTLANVGCSTEQAVHVGDHLTNDILGAHNAGIRTVWVAGFDDTHVDVSPTITIKRIADLPAALERLRNI